MATALSIAKEFVRLSLDGEEVYFLTPLALQNLLYHAQGWSLAVRRADLFDETIQAWKCGPVVRELWDVLPKRPVPITPEHVHDGDALGRDERAFVQAVWEAYGRHSPPALADMARREAPWLAARAGLPADAPSDNLIGNRVLWEHFERQAIPAPLAAYLRGFDELERKAAEELTAEPLDEKAFLASIVNPAPAGAGA